MNDKILAFIKELTELSLKHNFVIGGCGCCGSPWITTAEGDSTDYEELYFDRKEKRYKIYFSNGNEVRK